MIEMAFKWTIDPIEATQNLSRGLRNVAIRKAMNKAASVVKAAVVAQAPQRHGFLAKSIRIKLRQCKATGTGVAIVWPKSDYRRQKGKRKRGPLKGTPIRHRPSLYARLVERGTRRSTARPFLRPALHSTWGAYQQILSESLREQVRQLLDKRTT